MLQKRDTFLQHIFVFFVIWITYVYMVLGVVVLLLLLWCGLVCACMVLGVGLLRCFSFRRMTDLLYKFLYIDKPNRLCYVIRPINANNATIISWFNDGVTHCPISLVNGMVDHKWFLLSRASNHGAIISFTYQAAWHLLSRHQAFFNDNAIAAGAGPLP